MVEKISYDDEMTSTSIGTEKFASINKICFGARRGTKNEQYKVVVAAANEWVSPCVVSEWFLHTK